MPVLGDEEDAEPALVGAAKRSILSRGRFKVLGHLDS